MSNVTEDQQAMHDALGILGFDNDGDPTPAPTLAGMGADRYREFFLRCIREARADHDAAIDESCDGCPLNARAVEDPDLRLPWLDEL